MEIKPLAQNSENIRLIFDSSHVGIIHLDEQYHILYSNPAFRRIIGYSEEELRDLTVYDITHPEDLVASRNVGERLKKIDPSLTRFEKRYLTKDGNIVWTLVSAQKTLEPLTGEVRFFSIVEDITERKKSEFELKNRESDLKRAQAEIAHFFDASIDLMCVATTEGYFKRVNEAFVKTLGYTREELISRPYTDFVHPDDLNATRTEMSTLSSGRPVLKFENRYRAKSGEYRLFSWIASPDLETGLVYGTVRDITEKRQDELKLAYSAKMASLGEMAGGIAHEINNPLGIIMGKIVNLQTTLESPMPDLSELKEQLVSMELKGQRIAKIIRGLLTFSRNGERDPMMQISLLRVIEDTLELCRERIKSANIDLKLICESDIYVSGRATQLSQLLMNLISNSLDALEGSKNPSIQIELTQRGNRIFLSVEDNGRGVVPEMREKIMLPFFTTKEVGKGTGLGLSISKGVAEEHKGNLSYDEKSPNTRFTVELPAIE